MLFQYTPIYYTIALHNFNEYLSYSKYFLRKYFFFQTGREESNEQNMFDPTTILIYIVQTSVEIVLMCYAVFFSAMIFLYSLMYLIIFIRTVVPEIRYNLIRIAYFVFLILYIHFEPIYPFFMNIFATYHVVALLFVCN